MTNNPRTENATHYARIVGQQVRAFRRRAGLSGQQLAARTATRTLLPISDQTIRRIESGTHTSRRGEAPRLSAVTVDQLVALAEALDVDPAALLAEPACATCLGSPPAGFACRNCGATN